MTLLSFGRNFSCNDQAIAFNRVDFNLGDGTVVYLLQEFYRPEEADSLFATLLTELNWQGESIQIFGKWVKVPRLMAWYGDPDAYYEYSGVNHRPEPWQTTLLTIKHTIEQHCRCGFNSVLANLYRDGQDSMGWHSDNEKELGNQPTIASLSLGAEREFKIQHKKTKRALTIRLHHGDLLVMAGNCQQQWRHSVPKTKATKSARINLTFRKIIR